MPIEPAAEPHAGAAEVRPLAKAPYRTAAVALSLTPVNGWRGIGALAIAFAHLGVAMDFVAERRLYPIALFVDLFFVLSGLVIAQAYSAKLSRAGNIPEYVVRRFGRIWPVQAAMLALLVAYEIAKAAVEALTSIRFATTPFSHSGLNIVEAIPTNLLFLQSLGLHDRETWNFPSWSLSVEFATYVAFAAFCLVRPTTRRVLSIATIFVSLAVLAFHAPLGMRSTYDYGIFRCLAGFFAGTLCYEAAVRWPLRRHRLPTAIEIAALGVVAAWLYVGVGRAAGFAAPLVFALFVFAFVNGRGLVSRVLAARPLQVLSDLSFSIYMVHAPLLIALFTLLHALAKSRHLAIFAARPNPWAGRPGVPATEEVLRLGGFASAALVVGYLAAVLLVSVVVYRLVEVPGRGLFARLAKRMAAFAPTRRAERAGASSLEGAP